MKIASLLGLISLCWAAGTANAETAQGSGPAVSFQLLENKPDDTFRASMKFENTSTEPYKDWTLHFSFVRPILKLSGARIVEGKDRNGDFYSVRSTDPAKPLLPGQKVEMELLGKWFLKHGTDAPAGFFVSYQDAAGRLQLRELKVEAPIDDGKRPTVASDRIFTRLAAGPKPAVPLIPRPVQYEAKKGPGFELNASTVLIVDGKAPGAADAARFFSNALHAAMGLRLNLVEKAPAKAAVIRLAHDAKFPEAEGYSLTIKPRLITIKAKDPAGFHYAVQSLRQLLPAAFYQENPPPQKTAMLPAVQITDYPRFAWRGLHLDVARNFRPIADVKRLLDLMAMHKLNQFHWHLTDDEGWRLAIRAYPQLTDVGAFRGFGLPLAPALGSGPEKQGGFYTQAEIRDVVAYAKERQITIIPEIDMPGHARALLKSLPQLVDPEDESVYESVQAYRDNVLSACMPVTYEVMDNILKEVSELFPGPYIHVGGDEVPEGVWNPERSPKCKKLMAAEGLKTKLDMENYFFKRIKASVEKHGKKIAGWEEIIAGPGFPNRDVLTFAWKSSKEIDRIVRLGYPVILNPADHLYFDLAYSEDPREPGYYWAGTIDTAKVYSYKGASADLSARDRKNIRGMQGNLWSETIWTRQDLDYRAFPRVVALAEIAWTAERLQNWDNFAQRLQHWHLPRLQAYGVQYRVGPGTSQLTSQP
ncbi:family 20 glycosylhydrolase [Oligoflexus tunisiensis]|uniref:family 20 glycosylhydrolase n=1 Tax=Oligoflexus tunisiensis TaxID=708132 RepID=UPI000A624D55|nr:family 20 glycosylhydrolase [Oligoflexus tunisiensis]